jgi:hypothetical protein
MMEKETRTMLLYTLAQQVVDLSPDGSAIPGSEQLNHLAKGIVYLALLACGVVFTVGAATWGMGNVSTNPYNVMAGKRACIVSLAGAALIGASSLLISRFFGLGQGIH